MEIKANELSLGNYINFTVTPPHGNTIEFTNGIITEIKTDTVHINRITIPYYALKPIPLTEEWLLRFGFEQFGNTTYFRKIYTVEEYDYNFEINFNQNGITHIESEYSCGIIFFYVHQLQNRYFALTGEELTIKNSWPLTLM